MLNLTPEQIKYLVAAVVEVHPMGKDQATNLETRLYEKFCPQPNWDTYGGWYDLTSTTRLPSAHDWVQVRLRNGIISTDYAHAYDWTSNPDTPSDYDIIQFRNARVSPLKG